MEADAALVVHERRIERIWVEIWIARVNRPATWQKRMHHRWSPIVGQRTQHQHRAGDVNLIGALVEIADCIAASDQVVVVRQERVCDAICEVCVTANIASNDVGMNIRTRVATATRCDAATLANRRRIIRNRAMTNLK